MEILKTKANLIKRIKLVQNERTFHDIMKKLPHKMSNYILNYDLMPNQSVKWDETRHYYSVTTNLGANSFDQGVDLGIEKNNAINAIKDY